MSSDVVTGITIAVVGLGITGGAIAGIVALARRLSGAGSDRKVWLILGLAALVPFVLLGLFLGGCGAVIATLRIS